MPEVLDNVRRDLTLAFSQMLAELEGNRLEVILVPQKRHTNEGGMIRVCASRNAKWYRVFCLANPSSRKRRSSKPDTAIKRARTIDALEKLIAGERATYHREELVRIARKMA